MKITRESEVKTSLQRKKDKVRSVGLIAIIVITLFGITASVVTMVTGSLVWDYAIKGSIMALLMVSTGVLVRVRSK